MGFHSRVGNKVGFLWDKRILYNRILLYIYAYIRVPSIFDLFLRLTCKEWNDVRRVLEEVPCLGMQLAHPAAVVIGPHIVDDDAAVGVGEAEEHDPAVLVRRPRVGEAVGDSVRGGPETVVERFVRVAHQRRVRVRVLHQRRGRRQLQRG